MKRKIAIVIFILLLLSLCACKQTETNDPLADTSNDKTTVTEPTTSASSDDGGTQPTEKIFSATIIEQTDSAVIVEPLEGEEERKSSDKISFGTASLADIGASLGDIVEITYDGVIMESYPAQIAPTAWKIKT